MSFLKSKVPALTGKPLPKHVERALFLLIGLLLHALPRYFRHLSQYGYLLHEKLLSAKGYLAHDTPGINSTYFANNALNISGHILTFSNESVKDITQNSCPALFSSLDAPITSPTVRSWWLSAARLARDASPTSFRSTVFAIISAYIGCKVIAHVISGFRLKRFSQRNACLPVKIMPNPFPWKLRRYFELSQMDANLLDDYLFKKYERNGLTHGLGTVLTKRVKAISTIESENFKAVLSSNFDDWERPAFRAGAASPFLKTGILTLDGPHWAYSRKAMKSQFTRKQIDDNLEVSERHLQNLWQAMGRADYNGWTETANFMDYFLRFAMDSSTEFLFGLSANTQVCAMVRDGKTDARPHIVDMDGFEEAFKRCQTHVGVRTKLGRSYWMVDGFAYRKACRDLGNVTNTFIAAAIERAKDCLAANKNEPRNVIEALVGDGHDFDYISNQGRHLIIAGFETTSAFLGFSFALIAQHPEVFKKLRAEVLSWFGTELNRRLPLNFENLKNCKYMQYVINETLRLYPAGPSIQRVAVRDTVLPRGGGPDGQSPIVVPKNSTIQLGIYLAHRRKDIWGQDANEFVPERWEGRRKGYDFIPFIAGPQICLGQQYSMTQAAFVIARFMMKFDKMEKPLGQDNLRKGWQTVLCPGNGVKLRMRLAEDQRVLSAVDFPY